MIVVFCGLPATGKSFLARHVAKEIDAVHLNTDVVRKEAVENPVYSEEEKKQVYDELFSKARELVSEGKNLVLDGTFYRKGLRDVVEEIASSAEQKVFYIECRCDEKTVKKRLEKRKKKKGASDADNIEIYRLVEEKFEPIEYQHLVVDCKLPEEEKIERVLKWLNPE